MRTIILYESLHHGNTRKLVDAIAEQFPVELHDARSFTGDLSDYDAVGFASGIAFGKIYNEILDIAIDKMPFEKDVFFICTAGSPDRDYAKEIRTLAEQRQNRVHGAYCCRGFDTFGPLKLIGGINKGCPTEDDIRGAVDYYQLVLMECGIEPEAEQLMTTQEGSEQ